MPKPWELDWSAGAPAPVAMPLPIMPFFARPRAPMLDEGAAASDPSAMGAAYGMLAGMEPGSPMMDPSAALSAARNGMVAGDLSAMFPSGPSPADGGDPSPADLPTRLGSGAAAALMIPPTESSPLLGSGAFSPVPTGSLPGDIANRAAQRPQLRSVASSFLQNIRPDAAAPSEDFLQPATLSSWSGFGTRALTPPLGGLYSNPPSLALATQQARAGRGRTTNAVPVSRPGGSAAGALNIVQSAPSIDQGIRALRAPARSGAAQSPAPRANSLQDEIRFQANINRILQSGKLAPDKKAQLIQGEGDRFGRSIDPRALKWILQTAGNGQKIGYMRPGEILSYALRGVRLRNRLVREGYSAPAAAAMAANSMVEGRGYYRAPQLSGGGGYGLWQWNAERRAQFEKLFGKKFSDANEDEQIRFAAWEMQHHPMFRESWDVLHSNRSAGQMAVAFALNYERMANKEGDPQQRAAIAEVLNTIPIDPHMDLSPPSSPPPEIEAFLRRQAAKARSVRR